MGTETSNAEYPYWLRTLTGPLGFFGGNRGEKVAVPFLWSIYLPVCIQEASCTMPKFISTQCIAIMTLPPQAPPLALRRSSPPPPPKGANQNHWHLH